MLHNQKFLSGDANNAINRYERVNQDILKSRERCLKVAEGYVKEGLSVAVGAYYSLKHLHIEI